MWRFYGLLWLFVWRTHHGWVRQEKIWKIEIRRFAKNHQIQGILKKIPWFFSDFGVILQKFTDFSRFPWLFLKIAPFPGFLWPLGTLIIRVEGQTHLWIWYANSGRFNNNMTQNPPNKNITQRKAWIPYSGSTNYGGN